MLIASQSTKEIMNLKLSLKSVFETKELGEARKILGIEIKRNRQHRQLILSQKSYLSKLVKRYNMSDAKGVSVPFAQHIKLLHEQSPRDEEDIKEMSKIH